VGEISRAPNNKNFTIEIDDWWSTYNFRDSFFEEFPLWLKGLKLARRDKVILPEFSSYSLESKEQEELVQEQ